MEKLSIAISKRISRWKRGKVFFANDFSDLGTSASTRKALQRLVDKGVIQRLVSGIYVYPEKLPNYMGGGSAFPGHDTVAMAIARRDKLRIAPNIAQAQNLLGLSTQMPMNVVYWTDGSSRTIDLNGHGTIVFRHSDKMERFAYRSRLMQLIVCALDDISLEDPNVTTIIKEHLGRISDSEFTHDIKLVNDRIKDYLLRLRTDEISSTRQKGTTATA